MCFPLHGAALNTADTDGENLPAILFDVLLPVFEPGPVDSSRRKSTI